MPPFPSSVTKPRRTLDSVVRQIHDISSLPQVALEIMKVANDPDSGAADLKDIMESDAAMSSRVLRCVNSSATGVRVKITNLQQAIAYLGLKQIRNLAMTISVSELFRSNEAIGNYQRSALWRHLVSVGICARMLAMRMNIANFEDFFLAGLLHDIGIILEDQHAHKTFVDVIESLDQHDTLAAAERAGLGFDHTMLGAQLAATWKFPESAQAAIRFHHMSNQCKDENAEFARAVEVANLICTLKDIPSVGQKKVTFSRPAFDAFSLSKEDISVLAADLDEELAASASLFQI